MSDAKKRLDIAELMSGPIHRMSHVNRYSSLPVIRKENVAEHSWYVTFYAFILGHELVECGHDVDMGELLSRALVHDLDESMTGDFLRYVKYGHPGLKSALDEVSESMLDVMSSGLGPAPIKYFWSRAKGPDLEGDIIQVADFSRVVSYVWEEIKTGNKHLKSILSECRGYLHEFIREEPWSPVDFYAGQICCWIQDREKEINSGDI